MSGSKRHYLSRWHSQHELAILAILNFVDFVNNSIAHQVPNTNPKNKFRNISVDVLFIYPSMIYYGK